MKLRLGVLCALAVSVVVGEGGFQDRASLPETIKRVKPSVVGVGTFFPTRKPAGHLLGTGFAVGDGSFVLTSAHVYRGALEDKGNRHGKPPEDFTVVFVSGGDGISYSHVTLVSEDREHDVALLKLTAKTLPPLSLSGDGALEEGQSVAFTGFPIGSVLGLHPATHLGIVSAITPIVQPAPHASELDGAVIERLRNTYSVYQLDAVAYPGNSGSPLYDPDTGEVYGIVNSAFVKGTKEKALTDPSGITYAVPIRYAVPLVDDATLAP